MSTDMNENCELASSGAAFAVRIVRGHAPLNLGVVNGASRSEPVPIRGFSDGRWISIVSDFDHTIRDENPFRVIIGPNNDQARPTSQV